MTSKLPIKKNKQFWCGYNYEDIAYYSAAYFHCVDAGVYTLGYNLGIEYTV